VNRKVQGWFCIVIILSLLSGLPAGARADWSFRDWIYRLFHFERPSPDESALAPQVPSQVSPFLLRELHSRFAVKRLQALNAISQMRDTSPRVLFSLIQATQDSHPEIAQRATQALSKLCLQGHTEEVLQAFRQNLKDRPREIRFIQPEFSFKILNAAEEARAQSALTSQGGNSDVQETHTN
jgi:hypothetical protein